MDLDAVRTFVAVAEAGRFTDAADDLAITQQAVSKRIATLERRLGVRLFERTARGAEPTDAGRSFLPHARDLLDVERRALGSVGTDRPLRVDVIGRRLAVAALVHEFHRARTDIALDVVVITDPVEVAFGALASGAIDVTFRAVSRRDLPPALTAHPVLDEPLIALVARAHPLAAAGRIRPADLAGWRILMPGNIAGSEWAAYYDALAAEFGLTIDVSGPNFGLETLLDTIAGSDELVTFVGAGTRVHRPDGLCRVPIHDPTPVYPHALVRRIHDDHPGLRVLHDHLANTRPYRRADDTWRPDRFY